MPGSTPILFLVLGGGVPSRDARATPARAAATKTEITKVVRMSLFASDGIFFGLTDVAILDNAIQHRKYRKSSITGPPGTEPTSDVKTKATSTTDPIFTCHGTPTPTPTPQVPPSDQAVAAFSPVLPGPRLLRRPAAAASSASSTNSPNHSMHSGEKKSDRISGMRENWPRAIAW